MPIRISKNRVALQGIPLNLAKSASIVSASTVNLATATGNEVHITGSTGPITSFGTVPAGTVFTLIFDSTPTLTYNVTSMILNTGGLNYTCVAGDRACAVSEGSGNWVVTIIKNDGTAVAGTFPVSMLCDGVERRFNTVGAAVRYIIDNCPPPTRIYSSIGGTVAANMHSDVLTFTGLAEKFNIYPNGSIPGIYPIVQPIWIDIDNAGLLRLVDSVVVDPNTGGGSQLIMATGFNLANVTGKTFKFYTLPTYVIHVPPGNNVIDSELSHSMVGIRANVSFIGDSKFTSQINFFPSTAGNECAIGFPDAGLVSVKNIHTMYAGLNRPWGADSSDESAIAEQMFALSVTMESMVIEAVDGATLKDAVGLLCARIYVQDLHIKANSEAFVFQSDSMVINGLFVESKTSSVVNPSDFRCSWFQKTKVQYLNNVRYRNPVGLAPIAIRCCGAVVASTNTKEVFVSDLTCGDLYVSTNQAIPDSVTINTLRSDSINLAGDSLFLFGETSGVGGQAPVTQATGSGGAQSTLYNNNASGSRVVTPSANAITPDANLSIVHKVSFGVQLTVNSPINARDGQMLIFNYLATAVISTPIVYNAIFKKSTIPSSTLNGQASHVFVYDATTGAWIQSGGPLVWL